jgi:glyoxylase-like metal-dependent hydrolase (beta-lactamase superfamily II)
VTQVALHRPTTGVTVVVSRAWDTTCTVVHGSGGVLVVDSPALPDELDVLAGLVPEGPEAPVLLVTHADWDHILAPAALPTGRMVCGPATAERLAREEHRLEAERDAAWRVHGFPPGDPLPRPAALRVVPPPAVLDTPAGPVSLHHCPGHTPDGTAYLLVAQRVLCPGDHLSPREIPQVHPGGLRDYIRSLDLLEGLLAACDQVVPGHGGPLTPAEAAAVLAEDRAYLRAILTGEDPTPPRAHDDPATAAAHGANLRSAAGSARGRGARSR